MILRILFGESENFVVKTENFLIKLTFQLVNWIFVDETREFCLYKTENFVEKIEGPVLESNTTKGAKTKKEDAEMFFIFFLEFTTFFLVIKSIAYISEHSKGENVT